MKTILIEFCCIRVYSLYTHTCASMHAWESQERGNAVCSTQFACPVPLPTRGKVVTLNPGLERSHSTVLVGGLTLSLPTEPALLHWFPFCTMSPVGRSSQCPHHQSRHFSLFSVHSGIESVVQRHSRWRSSGPGQRQRRDVGMLPPL